MKRRVLFIDRDGTLIVEPPDKQIDSLEKLEFVPGAITALAKIASQDQYELVMVTNQDGLGTERFPEGTFWPAHTKMMTILRNEGIAFSDVHIDGSLPEENKPTRKPGVGMLGKYFGDEYDLTNSYVIGDRLTDLELSRNLGAKGILLAPQPGKIDGFENAMTVQSWKEIVDIVLGRTRAATVRRTTSETDCSVELLLNAAGVSSIQTGLGFLDHMLDQLARHGGMNLILNTKGDLHVDEHHTVEDTALSLGQAFREALSDKRGLARYGFCLPMDDCLAQVAIDFGGRPWLAWDVAFKREKIGDVPTELFFHFFKSFSDAALCNLNIRAEGTNEHHKIESIFKAFARAVRMAVRNDDSNRLPSTKGSL